MPLISAGSLDRRLTLWKPTSSPNALGEPVQTFQQVADLACRRDALQGAEKLRAMEISAAQSWRFTIRYSTGWADINPAWRLRFEGLEFNIEDVVELGRHEGFTIRATARAEGGPIG